MSKYLVKNDFVTIIDEDNIDQITDSNDEVLSQSIDEAVEEVASFIRNRYDEEKIFKVVKEVASDTVSGVAIGDRFYQSTTNKYYVALTATGTDLTSTTDFSEEDNRNAKIKQVTIDVCLYNIHSKISPKSIPEVRHKRYDGMGNMKDSGNALSYLKSVRDAILTPDLPVIEDAPQNTESWPYGKSPNLNTFG